MGSLKSSSLGPRNLWYTKIHDLTIFLKQEQQENKKWLNLNSKSGSSNRYKFWKGQLNSTNKNKHFWWKGTFLITLVQRVNKWIHIKQHSQTHRIVYIKVKQVAIHFRVILNHILGISELNSLTRQSSLLRTRHSNMCPINFCWSGSKIQEFNSVELRTAYLVENTQFSIKALLELK